MGTVYLCITSVRYPEQRYSFTCNIDFIARQHRRHFYWDHDF